MKGSFQELTNEIVKREFQLENAKSNLEECVKRVEVLKESITPEIRSLCDMYSPGSLDVILNEELYSIDNAKQLANNLERFINETYEYVRSALS